MNDKKLDTENSFDCALVSEISDEECEGLVDLFVYNNGENWYFSDNWLIDNNPCGRYGIECQFGHVQKIDLAYNNLSGELHGSFSSFVYLRELVLGGNLLAGEIGYLLEGMSNLEIIEIGYNNFSGEIFEYLTDKFLLTYVSINDNNFGGMLLYDIGTELINLNYFLIAQNNFCGLIPESFTNLNSIEQIWIFSNNLITDPSAYSPAMQDWLEDNLTGGRGEQDSQECPVVCGNGTVDIGEQCDDGNTVDGDGCSSTCENEWQVRMKPDISHFVCGGEDLQTRLQVVNKTQQTMPQVDLYMESGILWFMGMVSWKKTGGVQGMCPAIGGHWVRCSGIELAPSEKALINVKIKNSVCSCNNPIINTLTVDMFMENAPNQYATYPLYGCPENCGAETVCGGSE